MSWNGYFSREVTMDDRKLVLDQPDFSGCLDKMDIVRKAVHEYEAQVYTLRHKFKDNASTVKLIDEIIDAIKAIKDGLGDINQMIAKV